MVTVETFDPGGGDKRGDVRQTEKSAEMTAGGSIVEVISKVVAAVLGILGLAEAVPLYMMISIAVTVVL